MLFMQFLCPLQNAYSTLIIKKDNKIGDTITNYFRTLTCNLLNFSVFHRRLTGQHITPYQNIANNIRNALADNTKIS